MKIMNVKFPVWIIYKKGFYSLFIGNFIHISGTMGLMLLSEQDGIQKRKSAVISKPNEPARGCMPVRQYHRRDESKIVPHVRRGLQLDNL